MSCSRCGSENLRNCNCPPKVRVVTQIVDSPCTGCTTQVDGRCVFYRSSTTSCLGIKSGDIYDDIIKRIDTRLCTLAPATLSWTDIPAYLNGFTNAGGGAQTGQYSNILTSVIRLRGSLNSPDYDTGSLDMFILPVGYRPLLYRIFPVVVAISGQLYPGEVAIAPNGAVALGCPTAVLHDSISVSLDGISFETN